MEAFILDKNYDSIAILDTYVSFIWTDRYSECGDFEIYLPATQDMIDILKPKYYLWRKDTDRVMIIEDVTLTADAEQGSMLDVTGRSLESILDRRIVYGQQLLTGNFQNGIKRLLQQNIISPSVNARRIPNFTFKQSSDPAVTRETIDVTVNCENLYDVICDQCKKHNLGFRVKPNYTNGGFVFELYAGKNRSYDQDDLPWVMFTPKYENLLNSEFVTSTKLVKNVVLVGGEGEESAKDLVWAENGSSSGLERRELYIDASGVSKTIREEQPVEDPETGEVTWETVTVDNPNYISQLREKGLEEIAKHETETAFTGEIDAVRQFVYGVDFDIGDVVQVANEYGMEKVCRVSEVVRSHDDTGDLVTPTFVDAYYVEQGG